MTETLRGRWSFSLRTAFILMTVICLVLGWRAWSLSWIRARHEAIGSGLVSVIDEIVYFAGDLPRPRVRAPGGLWIFGEKGRELLRVDQANLESVSRLFPEAEIAGLSPAASKPRQTALEQGIQCFAFQSPSNRQPVAYQAREKIRKALDEPTSLDCIDTPLTDIVEYLKSLHQIEIQIDSKALEDSAAGSDVHVTKHCRGMSLDAALDDLLTPLELAHVIQYDVLLITSNEKASLDSVQAYDCRWAAGRIPQLVEALSVAKLERASKDKVTLAATNSVALVPAGKTIVVRANAWQHDAVERLLSKLRRGGTAAGS